MDMMTKDFTPTKEQISLHGLGFIQVILPNDGRLHVWHPDLPRRSCYEHSSIHNHRFGFTSRVLIGTQVNQPAMVRENPLGSYDIISHDGPRSEKGGRLSYVAGRADVIKLPPRSYGPGEAYDMDAFDYHCTPCDGIVVTHMQKRAVSTKRHANSLIVHGYEFDQSFDRFALSPDELWAFALDAFKSGHGS
jgi:hypothetical protein